MGLYTCCYRYCSSKCLSELAELNLSEPVPCFSTHGRSILCSNRLLHFPVTFHKYFHKDIYINSFFLYTNKLWNSLSAECFPLTYYLKGFKFRVNMHLLSLGSIQSVLMKSLNRGLLLFLAFPYLLVSSFSA